jgi:hypothetical protein
MLSKLLSLVINCNDAIIQYTTSVSYRCVAVVFIPFSTLAAGAPCKLTAHWFHTTFLLVADIARMWSTATAELDLWVALGWCRCKSAPHAWTTLCVISAVGRSFCASNETVVLCGETVAVQSWWCRISERLWDIVRLVWCIHPVRIMRSIGSMRSMPRFKHAVYEGVMHPKYRIVRRAAQHVHLTSDVSMTITVTVLKFSIARLTELVIGTVGLCEFVDQCLCVEIVIPWRITGSIQRTPH